MKKIALASLCCAALFTACGDDSSSASNTNDSDIIAKTFDDLPACSDTREGTFAYVKDKKQAYTCHNKAWTSEESSLESSSSITEDESSSSKASSSSEAAGTKKSSSSTADKPSSSTTDKPSSSAADKTSSSETEAKSSGTGSSSSAEPKSSAESSSSEKSSSSVASSDINVGAYQYLFSDLDYLNISIYNNEAKAFDSLTLRLFFTAKAEQVDNCGILMDFDICEVINEAGFRNPCEKESEIHDHLRSALPIRIESSYDPTAETYTYYYPLPLGSTTIAPKTRLIIYVGFSSGISNDNYKTCETLRLPAKKKFSKDSSDWSWMAHKKDVDGADYDGIPLWEMHQGDTENAPINPYISIYRKDELISGVKHPNL